MSVINVNTGTAGQAGSTAAELINELKTPMLAVQEFDDMLEQYVFEPVSLNNAGTVQFNRLERLGVALSPSTLTQGVAAKPEAVVINSVTITPEEYGRAVYFSSLAILTSRNDLVREMVRTLGYNVKETRDRLLYAIIDAATNTFRINDRANDNAIAVGDYVSYEEITQVQAVLDTAGAPKWPDGTYHLVLHTQQYASLQVDSNWLEATKFAFANELRRGEVKMISGVSVFKTNSNSFVKTASTTAGNSDSIRTGVLCGQGFAKVVDLKATKMHSQAPGQGSDWMERRHQLGWSGTFKGGITNQSFGRRVRGSSADAVAV